MEAKLFQFGIKAVLPELFQDPADCIHMRLTGVLGIDQNVVCVNNDKNVKLLGKDLVDVSLEAIWSIGQTKGRDLIFEVAIPGTECCLSLVTLSNSHLMIGITEIPLGKLLGTA